MLKEFYAAVLYMAICIYGTCLLLHAAVVLIVPILPYIAVLLVLSVLAWFFIWRRRY
jgi:hypothetical protein